MSPAVSAAVSPPTPHPVDVADRAATRERLLDAAERLFLEHGFDGATLRLVAAEARANVAAANYHFGGKDGLFQAMLADRLDRMNAERVALLDRYRAQARAAALPCERILAAMLVPALAIAREREQHARRGASAFLRLVGRAYVDPSPVLRNFLSERYAPMVARFKDAFARALPHLPRQELSWRLHFTFGALSYTLAGGDTWRLIESIQGATDDDARLLARLAPFLLAGLEAPVPTLAPEWTRSAPRAPSQSPNRTPARASRRAASKESP